MIYEQAKAIAQRSANREGVEYGIRKVTDSQWEYAEASWYASVYNSQGWSLDDIELVLPEDEESTSWPEVIKKWDNYDPTPYE